MTSRQPSIVRAGHSNWLIGGIAALAIIGLAIALFAAVHPIDQINAQQKTLQQQQTQQQQTQQGLTKEQAELHQAVACIEKWANSIVRRSVKLQPLANGRLEDLFRAFRVGVEGGHQKQALRIVKRAIREDTAYRRALRAHPIPLPTLHCQDAAPVVLPKPAATHPHPTPHPTVTVTVHAAPRIVTVPGPAVTHVVTRTVVRTVTVPPGHQHKGHR